MTDTPRHDEPETAQPCRWCQKAHPAPARGVCGRCQKLLRDAGVTEEEIFGPRGAEQPLAS